MKSVQPKAGVRANERVEYRIPEYLVVKKSDDNLTADVTVYDLIARYAGLRHVRDDVYVSEAGEEFIRTKYGFEPAVRYNHKAKLTEYERLTNELQYKLRILKEKSARYLGSIKNFEARSAEQKEKIKKLNRETQELKKELASLKKIIKKAEKPPEPRPRAPAEDSLQIDLGRSVFNDRPDEKQK